MLVLAHLDLDACFASIEQRDRPELKGKPVIVGSPPDRRGVVSTCSYDARKFGVHSGMASSIAKQKCPQGIFLPPRIAYYREVTDMVFDVLRQHSPTVETASIDEAYFDLTGACLPANGDPALYRAVPVAKAIKAEILAKTALTASIGIASNKFLAKVGSDFKKPDGLTLIPDRDKAAFLRPMPVRTIYGVGEVTEAKLLQAGYTTIAEVQDRPDGLSEIVGFWAPELRRLAVGEDDRVLDLSTEVKSISTEETFNEDTADRKVLKSCLVTASEDIARQLAEQQIQACTVQIRVRYGDFTTLTRRITLQDPISKPNELYRMGCFLLAKHKLVCRPLRLLGLGVSNLLSRHESQIQLNLG